MQNLVSGTDVGRHSIDWIGNWWLGFVVCGLISLIFTTTLLLYRRLIGDSPARNHDTGSYIIKSGNDVDKELYETTLANVHSVCGSLDDNNIREQEIIKFAQQQNRPSDSDVGMARKGRQLRGKG